MENSRENTSSDIRVQRVKFIVLKMLSFHSVLFYPGGVLKGKIGNPELRET